MNARQYYERQKLWWKINWAELPLIVALEVISLGCICGAALLAGMGMISQYYFTEVMTIAILLSLFCKVNLSYNWKEAVRQWAQANEKPGTNSENSVPPENPFEGKRG